MNAVPNGWRAWMMGALFAVVLAAGGIIVGDNSRRIDGLETRVIENAVLQAARGERISTLEAQMVALREQLNRIERLLEVIDARTRTP